MAVNHSPLSYVGCRQVPKTCLPIQNGGETGHWASPLGTSYEARSIPIGYERYTQYQVVNPIRVQQSLASPGELPGQLGYGVQYEFPFPMDQYVPSYLKPIK